LDHLVAIQAVLKELVKESINMPADNLRAKSIYEQLLILKAEVEEAIKSMEEIMDKNNNLSKAKLLLKKLANSHGVIVKNYKLVINPIKEKVLLIDLRQVLTPDWSSVFKEISLDEASELFINAENIEVDGRVYSWEQLFTTYL
jgi:hypothetical protein